MKTFFISDLHLSPEHHDITIQFKNFIKSLSGQCEALYILGDLFEVWIGDDERSAFQQDIAQVLKTASLSFPIYFMPGNRDFLLRNTYCQQSGIKLLSDPTVIDLYNKQVLLLHGDSLCTQDKLHQWYRNIVRSEIFIRLFLKLPLRLRQTIAKRMRANSSRRNQKISMELMDIHPPALLKLIQRFQVKTAVYGHTHRPSIWFYDMNSDLKEIYVLSDWGDKGNALIVDKGNAMKLIYWNSQQSQ